MLSVPVGTSALLEHSALKHATWISDSSQDRMLLDIVWLAFRNESHCTDATEGYSLSVPPGLMLGLIDEFQGFMCDQLCSLAACLLRHEK